jgi:hypothetical protein
MINAVFYSDQIIPQNSRVDERLLEMMQGRGNRIGYIPSSPNLTGRWGRTRSAAVRILSSFTGEDEPSCGTHTLQQGDATADHCLS